ncbi:MAG: PKD domain-containing protein [Bacteroidetes bacterium]|nr:MAG: PKD domain-containing protein [Bacteroidota bacterium]
MAQYLAKPVFALSVCALLFAGCDDISLPEEGSLPDKTPPSANFSYAPNEADYKEIRFTNLSISATDYMWDFGDGATSTDKDPSHTYAEDGTYTVSLTASDKLNVSDTYSTTIEVAEPMNDFIPEIINPGFDIEGMDSYRDGWRNGDLGGVIQITSSPVHSGEKAAKLPSAGDRIGYQLITVLPNTEYTLYFYYTMKSDPVGTLTVSMLAGHVTDPADIPARTIASVTLNDQSDPSTYVPGSLVFNSGDNTEVAIFFTNEGVECRIDTFSIEPN